MLRIAMLIARLSLLVYRIVRSFLSVMHYAFSRRFNGVLSAPMPELALRLDLNYPST